MEILPRSMKKISGVLFWEDKPRGKYSLNSTSAPSRVRKDLALRKIVRGGGSGSATERGPVPLRSTNRPRKSWCAHRVVSKPTLSDRIFRVLYRPRRNEPKRGLQIWIKIDAGMNSGLRLQGDVALLTGTVKRLGRRSSKVDAVEPEGHNACGVLQCLVFRRTKANGNS